MPNLTHLFLEKDPFFLEIVAELWGIDFNSPDLRTGAQNLPALMINENTVSELLSSFPQEAIEALGACAGSDGRLPWTQFEEEYGKLREMGLSRLEREQPYIFPENVTELLWYHAFIGRGFFQQADGLIEFAYIPDDLIPFSPKAEPTATAVFGRPSADDETIEKYPADSRISDQAVSLLAGLRMEFPQDTIVSFEENRGSFPIKQISSLLAEAGILNENYIVYPDLTREFLEMSATDALRHLAQIWLNSISHNDLSFIAEIIIETEISFDFRHIRNSLIPLIRNLPSGTWWNIRAFIQSIEQIQPEILRTFPEFDSWYLRDSVSGESLRGRQNWQLVEGRLITYLITGPLHWFGFIDLARELDHSVPAAFRLSRWADALLNNQVPAIPEKTNPKMHLDARGRIFIPPGYSRTRRYQISRFMEWVGWKKDRYQYTLTAQSIQDAASQGLKASHLVTLLKQDQQLEIPPNILSALQNFNQHGLQVKLQTSVILQVTNEKIINDLTENRFAKKYIIEQIGPKSLLINAGAVTQISQMVTEMGYFSTFTPLKGENHD